MGLLNTLPPKDFLSALSAPRLEQTHLGAICIGGRRADDVEKIVLDTNFPEPGYYVTDILQVTNPGTAEIFQGRPVWIYALGTFGCWNPLEGQLWRYAANTTWEDILYRPLEFMYPINSAIVQRWELINQDRPMFSSYERIENQLLSLPLVEEQALPFVALSSCERLRKAISKTPRINLGQIREHSDQFAFIVTPPYHEKLIDAYEIVFLCRIFELSRRFYAFRVGRNRKLLFVARFLMMHLPVLEFIVRSGHRLHHRIYPVYDILEEVFLHYANIEYVNVVRGARLALHAASDMSTYHK